MVHRIKRGHHGQQHLGRADVAGGLVATDVLLTGLQRQAQGRTAFRILGLPHKTARDLALVGLNGGEEGGVRTTKSHRHPQALGAAHGNVGPEGSHGRHQGLRQGIDRHGDQGTGGMGRFDHGGWIPEASIGTGQLQQNTKHRRIDRRRGRVDPLEADTKGFGAGLQHRPGLGQNIGVHQEPCRFRATAHPEAEAHRLGGGGGFIKQRRVGDRQARELTDQGLKVEQGLQTTLGDFRLVGGVGGVPGRILKNVALDQGRGCRAVVTQPDQGATQRVGFTQLLQLLEGLRLPATLGQGLNRRLGIKDVGGHDISDELLQISVAQGIEHAELFRLTRADVPLRKRRSQRRMHSPPDDRKSEAPALMRASVDVSRR